LLLLFGTKSNVNFDFGLEMNSKNKDAQAFFQTLALFRSSLLLFISCQSRQGKQ